MVIYVAIYVPLSDLIDNVYNLLSNMSQENVQFHTISILVAMDVARALWNINYFSI